MPGVVQLSVRPIQLWEIVYPEKANNIVLTTLLGPGGKDWKGQGQHKQHRKFIWGIRKALGVEEIPEFKQENMLPISKDDIEVIGIGVKKDYWVNPKDNSHHFEELTDEQKKEMWEGL